MALVDGAASMVPTITSTLTSGGDGARLVDGAATCDAAIVCLTSGGDGASVSESSETTSPDVGKEGCGTDARRQMTRDVVVVAVAVALVVVMLAVVVVVVVVVVAVSALVLRLTERRGASC